MNKTVILDLDGTLYFGDRAAPEAVSACEILKKRGYRLVFLTNNSTKTRLEIKKKLVDLGFPVNSLNEIYTSSYAMAVHLHNTKINNVYLLGSKGLGSELHEKGVICVDSSSIPQAVVVGLKTDFCYKDIAEAMGIIEKNRVNIYTCNLDKNFPIGGGEKRPGINALVSALVGSLSHNADVKIIGKPSSYMLQLIAEQFTLTPDDMCVVGDSEESDIAMANNYGCASFLTGHRGLTLEITNQIVERLG
ncbi:HAD-IIA family hydrolase [Nitratifractor salsuginis]|uniref:Haloacid dehalogenase domain protein hydrolase n=1 Tax=Nitratifractor salsuginis (strain DSM 16511 / JCM 12458 / E9I37-1) TaxID=749222 RepID=E6X2Z3_NITSE|nr:HAD-IIA family hydrolase [Nitratifractor salsuginis]ADV47276.1 Haloacid dehalogenase domain protein hydrolase [Nitratifractor salsuginis DSM 16511]